MMDILLLSGVYQPYYKATFSCLGCLCNDGALFVYGCFPLFLFSLGSVAIALKVCGGVATNVSADEAVGASNVVVPR